MPDKRSISDLSPEEHAALLESRETTPEEDRMASGSKGTLPDLAEAVGHMKDVTVALIDALKER